jgi:membrane protein required for beta-lactamase induction
MPLALILFLSFWFLFIFFFLSSHGYLNALGTIFWFICCAFGCISLYRFLVVALSLSLYMHIHHSLQCGL